MPGTSVHETGVTATSARTSLTSRGAPFALLLTVTVTVEPASPRTQLTISSISLPVVDLPSTATISSPVTIPPFSAGLPLNTPMMSGRPSSAVSIRTPIPTYLPDRSLERSARSSGVMNEVWPVSPTASVMPSIAP